MISMKSKTLTRAALCPDFSPPCADGTRMGTMVVNVAEKSERDFGRYDWERRAQANRCRSVESGLDDAKTGGDPSSGISLGDVLRLPIFLNLLER
jgi:hypothetical protein